MQELDAGDLIETDWKIFLPQSYRIGFHHFWADYNAWSGHYFIETLSNPDDKSLFIDNTRALCLSCNSAKAKRTGIGPKDISLVYTDKDGHVYTYKQELEWKLIMKRTPDSNFSVDQAMLFKYRI